jgi:hypothetical protein
MSGGKIYIKAWFGDWQEVERNKAKEFVQHFISKIQTGGSFARKASLIDGRHLKGVTTKELLG